MNSIRKTRPNTASEATHTLSLIDAVAGYQEAIAILCQAYSHADYARLAIVMMCESLGVPPLDTLNLACLPEAMAAAVTALADQGVDLDN